MSARDGMPRPRDPQATLDHLRAAHRRVHRPDPELRARVAGAIAADRRQEALRRWIGGSLVGAAMGVAALLVAHFVTVAVVARESTPRTPSEAEYQGHRDARPSRAIEAAAPVPSSPPPAPAEPAPPAPPVGTDGAAASPTPSASERTPSAPRANESQPIPTAAPDLSAEVRLLRQAEVALSTDPAEALALLQTHVRKFPRTSLPLERRALQILARCGTSPDAAAIAERDAFLREHPGSPYAARVRAACR